MVVVVRRHHCSQCDCNNHRVLTLLFEPEFDLLATTEKYWFLPSLNLNKIRNVSTLLPTCHERWVGVGGSVWVKLALIISHYFLSFRPHPQLWGHLTQFEWRRLRGAKDHKQLVFTVCDNKFQPLVLCDFNWTPPGRVNFNVARMQFNPPTRRAGKITALLHFTLCWFLLNVKCDYFYF